MNGRPSRVSYDAPDFFKVEGIPVAASVRLDENTENRPPTQYSGRSSAVSKAAPALFKLNGVPIMKRHAVKSGETPYAFCEETAGWHNPCDLPTSYMVPRNVEFKRPTQPSVRANWRSDSVDSSHIDGANPSTELHQRFVGGVHELPINNNAEIGYNRRNCGEAISEEPLRVSNTESSCSSSSKTATQDPSQPQAKKGRSQSAPFDQQLLQLEKQRHSTVTNVIVENEISAATDVVDLVVEDRPMSAPCSSPMTKKQQQLAQQLRRERRPATKTSTSNNAKNSSNRSKEGAPSDDPSNVPSYLRSTASSRNHNNISHAPPPASVNLHYNHPRRRQMREKQRQAQQANVQRWAQARRTANAQPVAGGAGNKWEANKTRCQKQEDR
jgi:hypothetical protein